MSKKVADFIVIYRFVHKDTKWIHEAYIMNADVVPTTATVSVTLSPDLDSILLTQLFT